MRTPHFLVVVVVIDSIFYLARYWFAVRAGKIGSPVRRLITSQARDVLGSSVLILLLGLNSVAACGDPRVRETPYSTLRETPYSTAHSLSPRK